MRSSSSRCDRLAGGVLVLFFSALGCTKSPAPSAGGSSPAPDPVTRGKSVYQSTCTACHNANPQLTGPLGPEIAKSPLDLIEARVMKAEYPPGYQPKRASHLIQP